MKIEGNLLRLFEGAINFVARYADPGMRGRRERLLELSCRSRAERTIIVVSLSKYDQRARPSRLSAYRVPRV